MDWDNKDSAKRLMLSWLQVVLVLPVLIFNGCTTMKGTSALSSNKILEDQSDGRSLANSLAPSDLGDLDDIRRHANQGDAAAQNIFGLMYLFGRGVVKNDSTAFSWFMKAAQQGHAGAQYSLGAMYLLGIGVARNYVHAVSWFRKSADQGHAAAQYNLGVMYHDGRGIVKNYIESYKWLSLSLVNGHKEAEEMLYIVKGSMTPAQVIEAKRRVTLFRIN